MQRQKFASLIRFSRVLWLCLLVILLCRLPEPKAAVQTVSFEPKTDFGTDIKGSVAAGDFKGDGKLDLAGANDKGNSRGQGDPSNSATATPTATLLAQFSQQGPKLVGTGTGAEREQGWSVSISADGNTAIVGGPGFQAGSSDSAARVWTRSGGVWTQQGPKLVGSDAVGAAIQGISVSISADGNTAIVGGHRDNNGVGAAWVWTRSGGVWTQQGNKLVGSGAAGNAAQGISVSISADGNTALIGGVNDNNGVGAAWVWTRSGGVWTQQGNKLIGSNAVGAATQGQSVALSADGNTAIVGGPFDRAPDFNGAGAVWVWTRSGGVWIQQGNKLVGSDSNDFQGVSVALSADGNTAIVGGNAGNTVGEAWVWTRSGGVWTQQGNKLVGSDAVGNAQQGRSVTLSADGNTAIIGGPIDDNEAGAVWVWTRNGGIWTQQGNKLIGSGAVGNGDQGWSVSISGNGNTVIVGGVGDDNLVGAAWVFAIPSEMEGPDFSLSFDQATIDGTRGTKARVRININRFGGFVGNVTIIPPDPAGGIVPKPPDPITTTDTSASFKLKIKGGAALGPHQITFTGRDNSGRERTATVTLVIQ